MPTARLTVRTVLRIGGSEARDFLQGLLTNDVTGALPVYAALLTAQGKHLVDLIVHEGGGELLLDVASSHADALAKRLAMYKLRRAVTIDASDASVFARWDDPADDFGDRPLDPRLPALGERWLGFDARTTASVEQYDAHRRALGIPDTAEMADLLWLETNAEELNGVSFTKGCYVGQENTARMHHRDKLRRRLLPLKLSGQASEAPIMAGAVAVGEVRSRVGDLGIAYLRMEHAAASLTQAEAPATLLWPGWLARPAG